MFFVVHAVLTSWFYCVTFTLIFEIFTITYVASLYLAIRNLDFPDNIKKQRMKNGNVLEALRKLSPVWFRYTCEAKNSHENFNHKTRLDLKQESWSFVTFAETTTNKLRNRHAGLTFCQRRCFFSTNARKRKIVSLTFCTANLRSSDGMPLGLFVRSGWSQAIEIKLVGRTLSCIESISGIRCVFCQRKGLLLALRALPAHQKFISRSTKPYLYP